MTTLMFGICSTGLFGYATYSSFSNLSKEIQKSNLLRTEMEKSVVNFSDRTRLKSQGIVCLNLSTPQYHYSISKLIFFKNFELREFNNYNILTGTTSTIIFPVEIEKKIKTYINEFLSDSTFNKLCTPSKSIQYIFSTSPSIIQCDGNYLSNLLQNRHGIRIMYDGNQDIYEVKTTVINSEIFLLGKNVGETFLYVALSDDKEHLINKVVSENDLSERYIFSGIFCLGAFMFSLASTLIELKK